MAEITRVPLQPIRKGSLLMLFVGILIGLAIAAVFAWATTPKGLTVDELTAGSGPNPTENDVVFVEYVGKLPDGAEFDRSQPSPFASGGILPAGTPMVMEGVIPGFAEGLKQMQKGGKYELHIPADKGYGANPPPGSPIPPNSALEFEIEVIDILSRQEAEQKFQAAQQMMLEQMQSGGAGAAPGAGAPAAPVPGAAQ